MNIIIRCLHKEYTLGLLLALCIVVSGSVTLTSAKSPSEQLKEQELKAAYIYNFIKFTDWPKATFKDEKDPLVIGVFDKDQQASLTRILKGKKKNDRPFRIVQLKKQEYKSEKNLQRYHALFFPNTLKENEEQIVLKNIKSHPVLVIGERAKFLEAGGMINFVLEKKKIRFEINLIEAEKAKLQIRAKLIRLAKRVIKKEEANNKGIPDDKEKSIK